MKPSHPKRMVNIVGGFLGAGKTTLLNHLLSGGNLGRTCVLVREYGETGIDGRLIGVDPEDIHMFQGVSFQDAPQLRLYDYLHRLYDEKEFDRLLMEVSGLENPHDLVQLFMVGHIPEHYTLGSYIAVVDARYGELNFDEYPVALEQVAYADAVIINKIDLADETAAARLEERIGHINGAARVRRASYARVDLTLFLNMDLYGQLKHLRPAAAERNGMDHIQSMVLTEERPMDKDKVDAWINALFSQKGQKILRSKGFFCFRDEDCRYEFQGVRKSFHSKADCRWQPDEERKSVVVLIGEQMLDEARLQQSFSACV